MKQQIVILLWVLYGVAIIGLENLVTILIPLAPKNVLEYSIRYYLSFLLLCAFPVLYRYLLYRYCCCCEKTSTSSNGVGTGTGAHAETTLTQPLIEDTGRIEAQNNQPTTSPPPRRVRYIFLDNVKVFLTVIVVSFHIACAFSPPAGTTIIQVDGYVPGFTELLMIFQAINQGYFMPLFFFISAFFVPSSYAKGRERFLHSKWKRILLPALVMTFLILPIAFLFSNAYKYGVWFYVFVRTGPIWFLYWLLLLNWVYMSIIESTDTSTTSTTTENDDASRVIEMTEGERKMPFPSTWTRLLYSVTLCGFVYIAFNDINPSGSYAGMPKSVAGSWTGDFFMFYAGILAKKHGWLEKDLAEQLDIPLCVFFPLVVIEGALSIISQSRTTGLVLPPWLEFVIIAGNGAYCVDMCLAVLIVFQRWFNYETKLSKIMARSAYCVYLIHTIILLATAIIYLELYRVVFGDGEGTEVGRIIGGFFFVTVATHGILWPLSYGLTRLPILRDII